MLQLGSLAFAEPFILTTLLGLPILWWLLRVTPPSPRPLSFPAIRLLFGLNPPEETPAHTPLWLLLLRFLMAALIIFGLSQPLLNPAAKLTGSGPLVLVIDDGWAAARRWEDRRRTLEHLLTQAEREQRPVILLTTAPGSTEEPIAASGLLTASEARRLVQGLEPKPWPVDRAAAIAALEGLEVDGSAQVVWISNGLADDQVAKLAARLQNLGRLEVLRDPDPELSRLLLPPDFDGNTLLLRAARASDRGEEPLAILATTEDGRLVGRAGASFADGSKQAEARLELPIEMRNRIARLEIEGEPQAGAVLLLDERWRRRPVGLVSGGQAEAAQPLLSDLYYLTRALAPFTELRRGEIASLLSQSLAVIALADVGALQEPEVQKLTAWVEAGGLLLRFAGPRLAEEGGDRLMPVTLRGGGRILGGVLTWDTPARLAPFDPDSPFAGLEIPDDILIRRQVLAEPTLDLGDKTWARLSDGTPLVTAERRGDGWLVLVHTTANTDWSNLALSGLFVDMLRRVVAISQGVTGAGDADQSLPPIEILDGFGRLGTPSPNVLAIDPVSLAEARASARHPPGYYGSDSLRRAHNLSPAIATLSPIRDLPPGVSLAFYAGIGEIDLKPWLLTAALVLALADLLISLSLRGLVPGYNRQSAAGLVLLLALPLLFQPASARAQGSNLGTEGSASDEFALRATLDTRFAYVLTGVPAVDNVSQSGLFGLARLLQRRTSVEAAAPMAVELGADELAFFPLLYWPITPEQRSLTDVARQAVNLYLNRGGTILFDLREPASSALQLFGTASRNREALKRLTEGIEIPRLEPVPPGHVLTKSFYLMQDFPGRYAGGTLWVGVTEGRVNDGVASVIIGSNDWAGAWAINETGRPLFAVVPGGERQREMAYRTGVNLIMYALTGNYKADQVHIPFILERLGQ